jgi:hypothetical protein
MPSLWSSRLSLVRGLSRPWTSMPSLWSSLSSVVLPSRRRLVFVCLRLSPSRLRLSPSPPSRLQTRRKHGPSVSAGDDGDEMEAERHAHVQSLPCPSRRARAASSVSLASRTRSLRRSFRLRPVSLLSPSLVSHSPSPPHPHLASSPPPFPGAASHPRLGRPMLGDLVPLLTSLFFAASDSVPAGRRQAALEVLLDTVQVRVGHGPGDAGQGTRAWGRGPPYAGQMTRNRGRGTGDTAQGTPQVPQSCWTRSGCAARCATRCPTRCPTRYTQPARLGPSHRPAAPHACRPRRRRHAHTARLSLHVQGGSCFAARARVWRAPAGAGPGVSAGVARLRRALGRDHALFDRVYSPARPG